MREPVNHKIHWPNERELRPFCMISKKHSRMVGFDHQKTYSAKGFDFTFRTPNNISLCLTTATREYEKAKTLYVKLICPRVDIGKKKIVFSENELYALYDYFEYVQTSLIFFYTAVEAFTNIAIPDDFTYERVNNKNGIETWGKERIERRLSTTEKLCEILPRILEVPAPTEETFWNDFKKLVEIRHNIIHQKTAMKENNVNTDHLAHFFDNDIFNVMRSGYLVIEYFCKKSAISHIYFPIGMGTTKIHTVEVENIEDYFDEISGLKKFFEDSTPAT